MVVITHGMVYNAWHGRYNMVVLTHGMVYNTWHGRYNMVVITHGMVYNTWHGRYNMVDGTAWLRPDSHCLYFLCIRPSI